MNEQKKKQIEEILKRVVDHVNDSNIDEQEQIKKGFLFIPFNDFIAGDPIVIGACDADLLKLKVGLLVKDISTRNIHSKVLQTVSDPTMRERLLQELSQN